MFTLRFDAQQLQREICLLSSDFLATLFCLSCEIAHVDSFRLTLSVLRREQ